MAKRLDCAIRIFNQDEKTVRHEGVFGKLRLRCERYFGVTVGVGVPCICYFLSNGWQ